MSNKEDRIVKWEKQEVLSLKPYRNKRGEIRYDDALKYLVRVIEQDAPHYDLVLGLASFATANKLSDKQIKKASEIIRYYEDKGVL